MTKPLTPDERRELLHIATVTEPDFMWTFRTPRANVTPLVRAGYVIEHPTAKDMYRVTPEGLRALEKEQSA